MEWPIAARRRALGLSETTGRSHGSPSASAAPAPDAPILGPDPHTPPRPILITAADDPGGLLGASWLLEVRGPSGHSLRDTTWHLAAKDLTRLDPAAWSAAPVVVMDGTSAWAAASARLPRRPDLIVIASTTSAWAAALALTEGPATVITMPDNAGWLLTRVTRREPTTSTAVPVDSPDHAEHHVTHRAPS